jgi:hypothetical protein
MRPDQLNEARRDPTCHRKKKALPGRDAMARGIGGRKGDRSNRQFLQLFRNVKRSEAYHKLGGLARAALYELIDRYSGINNGTIFLSVRELAYELKCSPATAARTLNELGDSGLAIQTQLGAWRGKRATQWRLMFKRCDKTGDLPETHWKQCEPFQALAPKRLTESHPRDTKVSPMRHKERVSLTHETQTPKNPIDDSSLSLTHETHVYVHQGE